MARIISILYVCNIKLMIHATPRRTWVFLTREKTVPLDV